MLDSLHKHFMGYMDEGVFVPEYRSAGKSHLNLLSWQIPRCFMRWGRILGRPCWGPDVLKSLKKS